MTQITREKIQFCSELTETSLPAQALQDHLQRDRRPDATQRKTHSSADEGFLPRTFDLSLGKPLSNLQLKTNMEKR